MKPQKQTLPSIYAVRIAGKNGWQIYNPPVTRTKLIAYLKRQGVKCLETRELLSVLEARDDIAGPVRMTVVDSIIMGNGWMYDSQGDCWRAPGEVYLEPEEQPVFADSFQILSDVPEAGWWDIGFSINGKEYWISSSEVHDPLCDYHNLILAVIGSRNIRITVDEERSYTDISIYSKPDGMIRFILKLLGGNEQMSADVLLNGREFVQKFYTTMRDFLGNSEVFEKGWLQEYEDLYDREDGETFEDFIEKTKKERGYPSYPVEEIETYLAVQKSKSY